MGRTRPPTRRMLAFRQALLSGAFPNAGTLAERFEVAVRTAQRDIEYVRDQLGWAIEYDPDRRGYIHRGRLELPEVALTEGDFLAVLVAMPLVARYRGTAYGARLKRLFERLSAGLPEDVDLRLHELDAALSVRGTGVPLVDPDVLDNLQDAVQSRRTFHARYQTLSRKGDLTERQIDPYHLCCVDGMWYLVGWCHLRETTRVFAAWRFRDVTLTDRRFTRPRDFDPKEFFANSFRVFCGAGTRKVVVRLGGLSADLLSERAAPAETRRRKLKDGRLEITLKVAGLQEVQWWVLGFGGECEVLAPKKLREMVLGHARRVLGQYRGSVGAQHAAPLPRPAAEEDRLRRAGAADQVQGRAEAEMSEREGVSGSGRCS